MESCYYKYAMVRVSKGMPEWFAFSNMVEEIPEVYPSWEIIMGIKKGIINEKQYTQNYMQQLATLDRDAILEKLREISSANEDKDVVLLCWESRDKFCHRHILAEWLNYDVQEL